MNIKLNESVDNNQQDSISQKPQQNIVDENKESIIFANKTKQFKFDCGVIMGNNKTDLGNKFSLKWHFDNTTDFESFINSVDKFISATKNKLTENDKVKLDLVYKQMSK